VYISEFWASLLSQWRSGDFLPENINCLVPYGFVGLLNSTTLSLKQTERLFPDRMAAFAELFKALKPGGILAVVELVFDPHFQTRGTVTDFAVNAGFAEMGFWGNRIAYVLHFEKPCSQ
jgi:hypothetical protein